VPTVADLNQIEAHPEPAYPEYAQVVALARVESGPFVDPVKFRDNEYLPARRGVDWCTAVLGRPFHGIRQISCLEFGMLVVADRLGLDPPLPDRVRRWRIEERCRQAQLDSWRHARHVADVRAWQQALAGCPVDVMLEVRPNVHGHRYSGGGREALRHAVPTQDALSGRARLHRAGRATCEAPGRARPLQLGEPTDEPVTCVRCLTWVPQLRPVQGA
jgi:hypothetical protein